ncbi:hypothetical protein GALMADRAFT_137480 [Galerina marginata CBS 339.88]|uniref:Uncharacterized protein n=1 Tax=Galerina marginata (strain CBS 339.88) TaxID=685588 RepID=A0A067T973_GALM3|nr:hypothetical protein GALMADRAFT_137480 [Galerina marginata CBS 339.88]
MPPLRLVSPDPDERLLKTFEAREAYARLRLHLHMAQLRTALRSAWDADRQPKTLNAREHIEDEIEQTLAHLGYCTVQGFRLRTPYLLQELAHTLLYPGRPRNRDNFLLPGSINMESNSYEDSIILDTTEEHVYWWKYEGSPNEGQIVTRGILKDHFADFWLTALDMEHKIRAGEMPTTQRTDLIVGCTQRRYDVPGFAPRPPPPLSPEAGLPLAAPDCPSCVPLRKALDLAKEKLGLSQQAVDHQIRDTQEAIELSSARIGAYTALSHINAKYGELFRGDGLPQKYQAIFPLHKWADPMDAVETKGRANKGKGKQKNANNDGDSKLGESSGLHHIDNIPSTSQFTAARHSSPDAGEYFLTDDEVSGGSPSPDTSIPEGHNSTSSDSGFLTQGSDTKSGEENYEYEDSNSEGIVGWEVGVESGDSSDESDEDDHNVDALDVLPADSDK